VNLEDYHSILARNLSNLRSLPPSHLRDLAVQALEDLL